ncbi:MAG: formylglycine-generating enzyme family protein [Deltaproteobacteria bacterium]|nr:formylglycine-generating enzyme family protein [Deltaproteobacteria bacterium]
MTIIPFRTKKSFVMVRIPPGEFIMGSPVGQGDSDEFPPHPVNVPEFLIGRYLITAMEWAHFLNDVCDRWDISRFFESSSETTVILVNDRYHPRKDCLDYPANGASWYGAEAYCRWLSERTGRRFYLPTEAQWEKAARGGFENKRYPWGNEAATGKAQHGQVWTDPRHTLSPVGAYPPNPYGLYDMAGNVWEWCADWYDRDYYRMGITDNPTGPEKGEMKVLRGGSWGGLDVQIRCGIRIGEWPHVFESRIGFRVARDPD